MRRASPMLPWLISLLGLVSGCAMPPHSGDSLIYDFDGSVPAELAGASMKGRGKIAVDASALGPAAKLGLGAPTEPYVRLAAQDAQCQAAARSSLANLIEMERGIAANSGKGCLPCKSDRSA